MKCIIDRFEGNLAVCEQEDGSMLQLPSKILPIGAREGDVLSWQDNGWQTDREATLERQRRIEEKRRRLFGGE